MALVLPLGLQVVVASYLLVALGRLLVLAYHRSCLALVVLEAYLAYRLVVRLGLFADRILLGRIGIDLVVFCFVVFLPSCFSLGC